MRKHLFNQYSKVTKCSDTACGIEHSMELEQYSAGATTWNTANADNFRRTPQRSRQRRRRREGALSSRSMWLRIYRSACPEYTNRRVIQSLVDCAVKEGWLSVPKMVSESRFRGWYDRRYSNGNVPDWAIKAAVLLAVDRSVYPKSKREMTVFTGVWSEIVGPFQSIKEGLETLPPGFLEFVQEQGVDLAWINMVIHDEVLHARRAARKSKDEK